MHSTLDELPEMAVVSVSKNLLISTSNIQPPPLSIVPSTVAPTPDGAPAGPEAERAIDKVLLVDRPQQHHHRTLENLVLQRRDADRTLLRWVTCFGDVDTFDGGAL